MRKYLVLMFVALVVGLALPASAFELPTSKPEEPTPGWSVEPVESQELGAASHAGSCDFALEYVGGPFFGLVTWVIRAVGEPRLFLRLTSLPKEPSFWTSSGAE